MALIILAHPYFDLSVANKTIIEELQQHDPSLEIRDIYIYILIIKLMQLRNKKLSCVMI